MSKKRTGSIVAVTVAKYATMYVESDTPEEAVKYAKEHCWQVGDSDFWDSDVEVDSWESYATEADEDMKKIWVEGGKTMDIDDYLDALEEQEELDKRQLNLFNEE